MCGSSHPSTRESQATSDLAALEANLAALRQQRQQRLANKDRDRDRDAAYLQSSRNSWAAERDQKAAEREAAAERRRADAEKEADRINTERALKSPTFTRLEAERTRRAEERRQRRLEEEERDRIYFEERAKERELRRRQRDNIFGGDSVPSAPEAAEIASSTESTSESSDTETTTIETVSANFSTTTTSTSSISSFSYASVFERTSSSIATSSTHSDSSASTSTTTSPDSSPTPSHASSSSSPSSVSSTASSSSSASSSSHSRRSSHSSRYRSTKEVVLPTPINRFAFSRGRLGYDDLVQNDNIDLELLQRHFEGQGSVTRDFVVWLLQKYVTSGLVHVSQDRSGTQQPELIFRHNSITIDCLLYDEDNVVEVEAPAVIVGDIHGQYYDLLELLRRTGSPADFRFVFLGDYVDRGRFSFEVITLLFAMKVQYPTNVWLLRGNHETRSMTTAHSFRKEVTAKFDRDLYESFMEEFDALPYAAVVSNDSGKYFCCHAGISPDVTTIAEINELDRFDEPPDEGPLADLIWSDPLPETHHNQLFEENTKRGSGQLYGYDAINDFLEKNECMCLIRAHQVKPDGFEEHWFRRFRPDITHPPLITLFSAPNYCDRYGNVGAYIVIDSTTYTIQTFVWQPHPFVFPNFQSAFDYSIPYLGESVFKFLVSIISTLADEDEDEDIEQEVERERQRLGLSSSSEPKPILVDEKAAKDKAQERVKMRQHVLEAVRALENLRKLREARDKLIADPLESEGSEGGPVTSGPGHLRRTQSEIITVKSARHELFDRVEAIDASNERAVRKSGLRRTRSARV